MLRFAAPARMQIPFPRNILVASSLGNHPSNKSLILPATMDFLGSLGFLGFLIYLRRFQIFVKKEIETKHITAADYTLHVRNLPREALCEGDVEEYFSLYGEVACVTICHKGYAERARLIALRESAAQDMEEFRVQSEAPHRFPRAATWLAAATRAYERRCEDLLSFQRQGQPVCCGHAFVTFSLESDMQRCLRELSGKRHFFGALLAPFIGPIKRAGRADPDRTPPPLVRQGAFRAGPPDFRGRRLRVARAPQASDIIWENLEVSGRRSPPPPPLKWLFCFALHRLRALAENKDLQLAGSAPAAARARAPARLRRRYPALLAAR